MVLPATLKLRDFQFEAGQTLRQEGYINTAVKTPAFYIYKGANIFHGLRNSSLTGQLVFAQLEVDPTQQLIHMPDGSLKAGRITIQEIVTPADLLNRESPEFIESAIYIWSYAYTLLNEEKRTESISLAAVQTDGRMLKHVPRAIKTLAICLDAVQKDGRQLKNVPNEIKTPALCLAAFNEIRSSNYGISLSEWELLNDIPDEFKTAEFFLELLRSSRFEYYRTHVRLESVFDTYSVPIIELIPLHIKTPAFLLDAVKQNGTVFWILNEEQRTEEIYLKAYAQSVMWFCSPDKFNRPKLFCSLVSKCCRFLMAL